MIQQHQGNQTTIMSTDSGKEDIVVKNDDRDGEAPELKGGLRHVRWHLNRHFQWHPNRRLQWRLNRRLQWHCRWHQQRLSQWHPSGSQTGSIAALQLASTEAL
jgi:hypothetical protein